MSRDTVIFDGECGVCRFLKDWAERHDSAGNLQFVAYQSGNLASISPGLSAEGASQALCFVHRDGLRSQGARAVFDTMRRLPGAWGVLGKVLSLRPLSYVAEPLYRLFARKRNSISHWLNMDRCKGPDSDLS